MTGLRGAAFARHVDRVGGTEGAKLLADEGQAAHEASAELQQIARSNTPAALRIQARAARRRRIDTVLLALVVVAGLLWIGDNAVGYAFSSKHVAPVSSASVGRASVAVDGGRTDRVDCWSSGDAATVWKAAPPFSVFVPYRCGEGPIALVPGLMSALALAVALLGAVLLSYGRRRHQRTAWY